jgi:hypothetical protein
MKENRGTTKIEENSDENIPGETSRNLRHFPHRNPSLFASTH